MAVARHVDDVDASVGIMATNPRTSLLLRGKGACKMVYGPPKVEPNEAIRCNFVDARAEMSADGRRLAVVEGDTVRVLDAQSGVELRAQPRPGVQALSISPLGTFIVTWEKLAEGATSGNLRVSSVETGELVAHWMQKVLGDKSAWPAVTWSDDEARPARPDPPARALSHQRPVCRRSATAS